MRLDRGTNGETRQSALWGKPSKGETRSSALWGKPGRGFVVMALVLALAPPGRHRSERPSSQAARHRPRGLMAARRRIPTQTF